MKVRIPVVVLVVLSLVLLNAALTMPARADTSANTRNLAIKQSLDFRSMARQIADELRMPGAASASSGDQGEPGGGNIQVNDPALDHIQTFPVGRPWEFSVESETTIAAFEDDILIGYNSDADTPVVLTPAGFAFTHVHLSGYSLSNDGGQTWASGFVPPAPGSIFTFGDPSVGVDRSGNFYYVSLGTDAAPTFTGAIIVNKFTNHGATVAPAVVAALDHGSDKEWLGVGPDPFHGDRDNLYVAWTSFQTASSELRFVRSTDGGATWSPQKTLFAPVDNGIMSAFIQFANPVVDPSNGRLYIPFLHFSNFDSDFIKVLVSDDGGDTFSFVRFNVPGAPDPFGFPIVTPGTLSDCGRPGGGFRLVLHQGPDLGGGRFGFPRFRQATRLTTQPMSAATAGRLFIAFDTSTSPFFGDPNSRSEIHLLVVRGSGGFAGPFNVAPATDADPQHVYPSVTVDQSGEDVNVAYYVQQSDGRIRVDLTSGSFGGGRRFTANPAMRVSTASFDLTPSNNPIPTPTQPFRTTNYDRLIVPCYDLGEYLGTFQGDGNVLAAWGDNRNSWTSPPGSPAAGTHAQPDVFFQEIGQ